jgi:long-chain acyl-CoA synthetase
VISVNGFAGGKSRLGTVGQAISNVEAKIAEDGELCVKGPSVMKGYWNLPEKTAEVFDSDGFFLTGDIAEIDGDGFIRITDRKKDLIVTAGGKNIAPQPIEALLKTNGYLVNAVMIGDRRRFPSMLLVPNFDVLRNWAKIKGLPDLPNEQLVEREEVREKLEREARKSLRDLAHFEMPKKFLILPRDFSIETGELTPKMSIKRKVVEQRWAAQIEELYQDDEAQH